MKYCTSCGNKVEKDAVFCRYCGRKFGEKIAAPPRRERERGSEIERNRSSVSAGIERERTDDPKIRLSAPTLILKYADFLDDDALYEIALAKESGKLRSDENEIAEIYRTLAFRGHLDGAYKYAMTCLDNANGEIAYRWLKIAADAGHEKSALFLKNHKREETILNVKAKSSVGGGKTFDKNVGKIASGKDANGKDGGASTAEKSEGKDGQKDFSAFEKSYGKDGGNFADLVKEAMPSCLRITALRKQGKSVTQSCGSGFIVEGGYVVTNAHVVGENPECLQGNFEPSVDAADYGMYPLAILPEYDVAILKFSRADESKLSKRKQFKLRTSGVQFGEEVYTIGNPLGMGLSVSRGVISSPNRASDYPKEVSEVLQTDITVNHGNSGGAMLDSGNNVIGMITFKPGESEGGITMGVPAIYIKKIIEAVNAMEKQS